MPAFLLALNHNKISRDYLDDKVAIKTLLVLLYEDFVSHLSLKQFSCLAVFVPVLSLYQKSEY